MNTEISALKELLSKGLYLDNLEIFFRFASG